MLLCIRRTKKKLNALFSRKRFLEKTKYNKTRPVLRLQKGVKKASLRLASPIPARADLIKLRLMQYPNISMPGVVGTGYPEIYPKECRNADFQVYVWEVLSLKNDRFKPINNKHYT